MLFPVTNPGFVNDDFVASFSWPGEVEVHPEESSVLAAEQPCRPIAEWVSFVTKTVYSHLSKLVLLRTACDASHSAALHRIAVPVELAVARVVERVVHGGHIVPVVTVLDWFDR